MTLEELHDAIAANPEAKALADAGNDAGCAAAISAALPKVLAETKVSYLSAAKSLHPDTVRRLIATVNAVAASDPLVDEIKHSLRGDGVDVAHPTTRAMLEAFDANPALPLTAADVLAIKALAEVPQSVTTDEVSAAWLRYRPEGRVVNA